MATTDDIASQKRDRAPEGVWDTLRESLTRVRWVVFTSCFVFAVAYVTEGDPFFLIAGTIALLLVTAATVEPREALASRPAAIEPGVLRLDARILAEALSLPTLLLNRSGRLVSINGGARDIFPAAKGDAPISFLIRSPDVLQTIDRVRTGGASRQVRLSLGGSREKVYDVTVSLLAQRGAEPLLVLQFADVTHAERVARMRTDFVANASHELRTPLASLLGFIETLQGPARNDPEARDRFLGIMAQQAQRMSRLISDLLSLSRVEERAHVRPRDRVEITQILDHVIDGLAPLARESGVALALSNDARRTTVRGDLDELTRVFENLIENAVKYGRDGERVEIDVTEERSRLRICVRDHGPGIAPEHLPRLMERFYRVDIADSRAKGGTGLGLALAKNILLRHGGQLSITSELGRGATFVAELPVAG